ncbi:MAG: hypothetical protein QW802_03530 [Candidatus Altiarchaeota archaeon]
MQRKKIKNLKISAFFALISFFVLISVATAAINLPDFTKTIIGDPLSMFLTFWHSYYMVDMAKMGEDVLYNEITKLILLNPPVRSNILLQLFMKIILPFYILAIIATGFYLIFMSSSPAKRATAKNMLTKFVIGMFLISVSPAILEAGLNFSERTTSVVLNMVSIDKYTELMKYYTKGHSNLSIFIAQLDFMYALFFPYLWLWWFIWGTFGIFLIRYAILTLWISIFPVAVFLYTLNKTHDFGRVMLEQTIVWTGLQIFNACVVVAVVLANSTIRDESLFKIGPTIEIPLIGPVPLFTDFFLFMSVFLMIMAMTLTTRLFRNFLP